MGCCKIFSGVLWCRQCHHHSQISLVHSQISLKQAEVCSHASGLTGPTPNTPGNRGAVGRWNCSTHPFSQKEHGLERALVRAGIPEWFKRSELCTRHAGAALPDCGSSALVEKPWGKQRQYNSESQLGCHQIQEVMGECSEYKKVWGPLY